jgi:DNA-binding beta-propeller fold protein YncE
MRKLTGLLLFCSAVSFANPFAPGDLFLSTTDHTVLEYTRDGRLVQTIDGDLGGNGLSSVLGDSAFDSQGNLYVTAWYEGVLKFDSNGNRTGLIRSSGGAAYSVAIGSDDSLWVGQSFTTFVQKFDKTGHFLTGYSDRSPDGSSGAIALSADEKTLYYASGSSFVGSFDLANNQPLPIFATTSGNAYLTLIKTLPDGGLLVKNNPNILRFDASGKLVMTYLDGFANLDQFEGLALDPNGKDFWATDYYHGNVYEVNLATGAIDSHFQISHTLYSTPFITGLSVFNGTATPEPRSMNLVMAAIFLALAVTMAKRGKTVS